MLRKVTVKVVWVDDCIYNQVTSSFVHHIINCKHTSLFPKFTVLVARGQGCHFNYHHLVLSPFGKEDMKPNFCFLFLNIESIHLKNGNSHVESALAVVI